MDVVLSSKMPIFATETKSNVTRMSKIGYARVSTREQNLDMQLTALKAVGCEKTFSEKVSGVKERPVLKECLDYLREGDTLVVYKFDRIGRSLKDLVNIFSDLNKRGIMLTSIEDHVDASSPSGKLMMNIFASLAEFERDLIIERTQAGREEARRRGKSLGKPKGAGIKQDKVDACAALYRQGLAVEVIMQQLGIKSKSTVYRYLRMKKSSPDRRNT